VSKNNNLPKKLENILERYNSNATIRSLIQLIPFGIGSAVDTAISVKINNIRKERIQVFFDELNNQNIHLSENELKDEDILHAYFSTIRTVLNTRRRKKIKLFGKLLSNFFNNNINDIDLYEEYLNILDDLSVREFEVLLILHKYEKNIPIKEDQNALQRASMFWDDFLEEVNKKIGIPIEEIPGFLTRLNRTGLYQTFVGGYFDYEGDQGFLTKNFYKFIKAIIQNNCDVA
jgi:CRISPR/Cas system CSM-associated protein Csm2 small subunit